jgi:hypothetical protein
MELSSRETWGLVHGILLGALFLLAFTGGLAGLHSLRPEHVTEEGIKERMRRLYFGTTTMAVLAWATVITGTWVVYPWYREKLAGDDYSGCAGLAVPNGESCSPRDFLLSNVSGDTENWHEFGMEWKEHIAWLVPFFATVAAFMTLYYGRGLARNNAARKITMGFFILAFATAVIAGLYGALITKVAPVK